MGCVRPRDSGIHGALSEELRWKCTRKGGCTCSGSLTVSSDGSEARRGRRGDSSHRILVIFEISNLGVSFICSHPFHLTTAFELAI